MPKGIVPLISPQQMMIEQIVSREEGLATTRNVIELAVRWVELHPRDFRVAVAAALKMNTLDTFPVIDREGIAKFLRKYNMKIDFGLTCWHGNIWPVLARYIRAGYPELKARLTIKPGYIEEIGKLPMVPFSAQLEGMRGLRQPITRDMWE